MSNPTSKTAVNVLTMSAEVRAELKADGYKLALKGSTDEVLDGALVMPKMNGKSGWSNGKDEGRTYVAPDGTKFAQQEFGKAAQMYGLSKDYAPVPLVLLADEKRPAWLPSLAEAKKAVRSATRTERPKIDYATMTDEQLVAWSDERDPWWKARAYQIEKAGVKGFQQKVRDARTKAGKGAVVAAKPEPTKKPETKRGKEIRETNARVAAKRLTKPAPKPSAKKVQSRKPAKKAASSSLKAKQAAKRSK
jgi:hypothetical protein